MIYDVVIIGAGVVGGAVARELGRYRLSVLCLEMESDVCFGISKGNTGIIHSPALIDQNTGKSSFSLRGNIQFEGLSDELGFTFQRTGALVLGYSNEDRKVLEHYRHQGEEARHLFSLSPGGYRILEKKELDFLEPLLNPNVLNALLLPDAGRIIPYEYGIGLWENAAANEVALVLNQFVESVKIEKKNGTREWIIETNQDVYRAKFVVNAAGHGSNSLGMLAGFGDSLITKIKGQYLLFDREKSPKINHILFQVPSREGKNNGKGILVTNTVYGNLMIGPDARAVADDEEKETNRESLREVLLGASKSVPDLDIKKVIKTFAGVRPKPAGGDFIVLEKEGFVHLCGIESPGLTSSPAIAEDVLNLLKSAGLELIGKEKFKPKREPIVDSLLNLPEEEVARRINLPDTHPDQLICRCEQVPRQRIMSALCRKIPVTTLDGVKLRTRAGQGRCQGSFCEPRVRNLLAMELNLPVEQITQNGKSPEDKRVKAGDLQRMDLRRE